MGIAIPASKEEEGSDYDNETKLIRIMSKITYCSVEGEADKISDAQLPLVERETHPEACI